MNERICVSIGAACIDDAFTQMEEAARYADVLEIRLDLLDVPAVSQYIEKSSLPLLFTNRASWEGGRFSGTEEERLAPLLEAVASGCAYVDLEIGSPSSSWQRLLQAVEGTSTQIIASWHDFAKTPELSLLEQKLAAMQEEGAHIGKMVTMAHTKQDAVRMLSLLNRAYSMHFPLIVFCMGEPGIISRVASPGLGGYMTYCAAEGGNCTAPGQVKGSVMRSLYALLEKENHD